MFRWRLSWVIEERSRWLAHHVFDCSVRGKVIVKDVDIPLVLYDLSASTEGTLNKHTVLEQRCLPKSPHWSDNGLEAHSYPTLRPTLETASASVSVFGDGHL